MECACYLSGTWNVLATLRLRHLGPSQTERKLTLELLLEIEGVLL